uniref:Uncharacterized protein n=1 Tax=viral metagenome TaxID=1070528 RepID=A0A6H1ZTV0_9ZZZZ
MEIEMEINQAGTMYIKEELRKILGNKIKAIANCKTVLLFPENTNYDDAIESLHVILKDLKIRARDAQSSNGDKKERRNEK